MPGGAQRGEELGAPQGGEEFPVEAPAQPGGGRRRPRLDPVDGSAVGGGERGRVPVQGLQVHPDRGGHHILAGVRGEDAGDRIQDGDPCPGPFPPSYLDFRADLLKPGQRSRLVYRPRRDDGRRDGRKSFVWTDYRDLLITAHAQLGGPIVLVWDNCETHGAPSGARV